jgi:hypothetical protein
MAKGRADLSFQAIADAITKVETAVRKKKPVDAHHLQLLEGLRAVLEAYCQTQRRPAECGDYCFIATPGAAAKARKTRSRG